MPSALAGIAGIRERQSIDLQAAGREMRHKALAASRNMEAMMNEDVFNVSIRKIGDGLSGPVRLR